MIFCSFLLQLAAAADKPPLPTTPKLTWYQTDEKLVLDVQVHCDGDASVQIADADFALECNTDAGTAARLAFELREPVVEPSGCKRIGRKQQCILTKHHTHSYDRLSASADALRGIAKVDYTRYQDAPEHADAGQSQAIDYSEVKQVTMLDSAAALEAARQEHDLVVLDVFYPWCTSCESKRAQFAAAAAAISEPGKVFFGAVDALEVGELRRKLNASCTWDCTHIVLRRDEPAATVQGRGEWEADALQRDVEAYARPALTVLRTPDQLHNFKLSNAVSVVGRLPAAEGEAYEALLAAAQTLRTRFPVALAIDPLKQEGKTELAPAGLHLVRGRGDGGAAHLPAAELASTNLTQWVEVRALDDLIAYEWEQREKVEKLGLACAQVFVDDADEPPSVVATSLLDASTRAELRSVASELRGKVAFLVLKKSTSSYMLEDFGFDAATTPLPAIGLAPSFDYDAPKFAYVGGELKHAPLRAFVDDFLRGRLEPTLKSAPPPAEPWVAGTPMTVVGSTLRAEVVRTQYDVLLCLHAPYFDEKLNATLHRLARLIAPAADSPRGARVAMMETMANAFDAVDLPGVDKYHSEPTLVIWSGAGEMRAMRRFKGKPTLKLLLPFVKKHSAAVRNNWPKVKALLDADNARTTADKEAEAAKFAALKAGAAAAEAVEVCCDGDGGVLKRVLREGDGLKPPDGSSVSAHYTGRTYLVPGEAAAPLMEGPVFDSSRQRRAPFDFSLGQGHVIPGWDQGFASMRVGERALLTIQPEYAYGQDGSPPKIPGGATLEFDVELLGFEPPSKEPKEEL